MRAKFPLPLVGRGRGEGREVEPDVDAHRRLPTPTPPSPQGGGRRHENRRRSAVRPHRARPAEFLYRPLGAAAQSGAAHPGSRPICERRHAAAHGACRLRALAACARADQKYRECGGEKGSGGDRGRHRRRAGKSDHAVGRRADPSQGDQIGAAARHRGRARLLAGRSGVRRRRQAAVPKPRMPALSSASITRCSPR